jgi:hypothetical protein
MAMSVIPSCIVAAQPCVTQKGMIVKATQIALIATVFGAAGAQAQLAPPPAAPVLQAERPATMRSLQAYPRLESVMEGLPPSDPQALDLYRVDPKLLVGFTVNSYLGMEAKITNPNYLERMQFIGLGPRLAQGAPLGVGGYNFDLVGRLTVPIDDRLSGFGKLGVAATERIRRNDSISDIGMAASVGTTYQLKNGQTLTAEVPLGPIERKALSGSPSGYGARLKLGF